jgi:hypothetical protein
MVKALLALVAIITLAVPARADWEADLKITGNEGGKSSEITGYLRVRKALNRMDVKTPVDMSTIVDTKTGKAIILMHGQKLIMESDVKKLEQTALLCDASDVEKCLGKQGFKKGGTDTFDGHPCTIYEGERDHKGKKIKMKVWRPNDLKEVAFVKSVGTGEAMNFEMTLRGVKTRSQGTRTSRRPPATAAWAGWATSRRCSRAG